MATSRGKSNFCIFDLNYWYFAAAVFFTSALLSVYFYYLLVASNDPTNGSLVINGHDLSIIANSFMEFKAGLAAILVAAGVTLLGFGKNLQHRKEIKEYKNLLESVLGEKRTLETKTKQVKTAIISVTKREPPESSVQVDVLKDIFPEVDEEIVTQEINAQDPLGRTTFEEVNARF